MQRVNRASVSVEGEVRGRIDRGLLVLVGVTHSDRERDADWIARRVAGLRVFPEGDSPMHRDVREVGGRCLVVPQFTLYGDTRRGRRPDWIAAARPEYAAPLVDRFCATLVTEGVPVERGVFQAHMRVELENDGPVTLLVESPAGEGTDEG